MFTTSSILTEDQIQHRLLLLAAAFLGVYTLTLTLAPAARLRSWDFEVQWGYWLNYLIWIVSFFALDRQTARRVPERDPYLLPIAALLTGWGSLTVWRIFPSFGLRQSLWLIGVATVFSFGLRLPHDLSFLRRYKYLWLTGGLVLTGLTMIFGTNPTGSNPRLWLGCCGVYFQPSEPLKLLLVVYLSAYLADRLPFSSRLLPLLAPTLMLTGLTLLLLLVQRDLGTASIFLFLFATTTYIATGKKRILAISALTLFAAGVIGYQLFDVVRLRIDAWTNPWLDPSGRSYQIVQSLLAIANGGVLGRGPGMGNPSLVPVPHSDFIFSAIAEETGLFGALGLLLLLAILVTRGLLLAARAPDTFRRLLAVGLTAYLAGQSVLIIGGNLRLLPLTGVTLPFVSYGGSSLLTAFLSLLILVHISKKETHPPIVVEWNRYVQIGGFLFAGIASVSLITGWWAFYRSPSLVERTDNPRRSIADRFVPRGRILDRRNEPISVNQGSPGSYTRHAAYPDLAPIVGYTNPIFGQSGLEASLDPYLRGLRGTPGLEVWWNHLLYGLPPPGLDVRLSLDLNLQYQADQMLASHQAALILMNAETGEILAIASHPTFDPDQLDQNWDRLIKDPSAPLFNRATLGRYQPGTALGPFLYAAALQENLDPALPSKLGYNLDGLTLDCVSSPPDPTWETVLTNGCPNPQLKLAESIGEDALLKLYTDLGFYEAPPLQLPTDSLDPPSAFSDFKAAALGQSEIAVSPLQMALAASTLSVQGIRPAPQLVSAVDTPKAGWVLFPASGEPTEIFSEQVIEDMVTGLAVEGLPIWQTLSVAPNGDQGTVTWYIAGTLPSWNGAPLVLSLLLEENNPELADVIGQAIFRDALQP